MKFFGSPVFLACLFLLSATALLVGAVAAPEVKPPSELFLVSPNGENTIRLVAGNETSGIWITHKDREEMVAIFMDRTGAAVGVYGDLAGGNHYSGVCTGPSSPDGRLQLAVEGKPKVFSAADLE